MCATRCARGPGGAAVRATRCARGGPPATTSCARPPCRRAPLPAQALLHTPSAMHRPSPRRLHRGRWATHTHTHTPLRTRPVLTAAHTPRAYRCARVVKLHKPLRAPYTSRAQAAAHTLPKTQPRPRPPPHPRMLSKLSRKQLQL